MYDMYPDYGTQDWGPAQHRDADARSKEANARALQAAFDGRDESADRPDDN